MSFWQNRFGRGLANAVRGLLQKKKISGDVSGGDRHDVKESAPAATPATVGKRVFPRRFAYLGGLYLLAIVVLVLVVFLRLGMIPAPGTYGLDRDWNSLLKNGRAGESIEDEEQSSSVRLDVDRGQQDPFTAENQLPEDFPAHGEENLTPVEEDSSFYPDGTGDVVAGDEDYSPVPSPASPLPSWHLHAAYGGYTSEVLPSGGLLHRRNRGVFLEGAPGDSVSALWDGVVITAGDKGFPCGSFVVLEHEGGYSTLYGNLRQIWVKEGDEVSRGENIGLLPRVPTARENELSSGTLPFHTVVGGGEDRVQAYSPFSKENPLLYLELRRANRYIDPFLFIEERN